VVGVFVPSLKIPGYPSRLVCIRLSLTGCHSVRLLCETHQNPKPLVSAHRSCRFRHRHSLSVAQQVRAPCSHRLHTLVFSLNLQVNAEPPWKLSQARNLPRVAFEARGLWNYVGNALRSTDPHLKRPNQCHHIMDNHQLLNLPHAPTRGSEIV